MNFINTEVCLIHLSAQVVRVGLMWLCKHEIIFVPSVWLPFALLIPTRKIIGTGLFDSKYILQIPHLFYSNVGLDLTLITICRWDLRSIACLRHVESVEGTIFIRYRCPTKLYISSYCTRAIFKLNIAVVLKYHHK